MIRMNLRSVGLILIVNIFVLFFYITTGLSNDYLFFFTNFIIITISIFGILYNPKQYFNLAKLFYLFSFFFFGIVPYLDNISQNYYWSGGEIDYEYFVITNILIITSLLIFLFINIVYTKKVINVKKYHDKCKSGKKRILLIILILTLSASYLILARNNYSFLTMLVRGVTSSQEVNVIPLSTLQGLIFQYFITPLPVISLLLYKYFYYDKSGTMNNLNVILLFSLCLIFVAPTSVARFLAAALYLAILLSYTEVFQKQYRFPLSMIFGLLVVFPFLDKFRHFDMEKFNFTIDYSFFQAGHFDAYHNFVRVISIDFVSYGYQLLGPLLFYVPRGVWHDKPVGSGHQLAYLEGFSFSNISMPFLAEGYVNFGVVGTVIFIILLSRLFTFLDNLYWSLKPIYTNHWFYNIYYLSLGLSFFVLRGDLMASFAYTFTILGSYVFFYFF